MKNQKHLLFLLITGINSIMAFSQSNICIYFDDNTYSNVFGGVHLHYNKGMPMFSLDDILALYNFYSNFDNGNGPNSSLPTHIMVSSLGVYAIKIEDISALSDFYNDMLDDKKKENLSNKLERAYDNKINSVTGQTGSNSDFEKIFLQLFTEIDNTGVSLYRANTDLDNWSKVELDESGVPQSESCP